MAQQCPHCGEKLPFIQDAFCPECHKALDELPEQPPSPVTQQSQQRSSHSALMLTLGGLICAIGLLLVLVKGGLDGWLMLGAGLLVLGEGTRRAVTNK
jgi:hypothetical protein